MSPTTLNSIPPASTEIFLGRDSTIRQVVDILSNKSGRPDGNICIVGGGAGIGKTALLWHMRKGLRSAYPDAQIYLNLNHLHNEPLRIEKTLAGIIHTLSPFTFLVDDPAELRAKYLSVLEGKKILILFDAVPTSKVISFLAPPATCALVGTARDKLEGHRFQQVALQALSPDDAYILLVQLCPRIGASARQIAEICQFQPLTLRLAAAYLNAMPELTIAEFLAWVPVAATRADSNSATPETIVERLIKAIYNAQSPQTQKQLQRLSLLQSRFGESVASMLLENASDGIPNDGAVRTSLQGLVCIGFLQHDSATSFEMPSLVRDFVSSEEKDEDAIRFELAAGLARRAAELLVLGQSSSDGFVLSLDMFDDIEPCIQEISSWARANAANPTAGELLYKLVGFAGLFGRLRFLPEKELIPWFQAALDYALHTDDREGVSGLLTNLNRASARLNWKQQADAYFKLRSDYERLDVRDERALAEFISSLEQARALGLQVEQSSDSVVAADPPRQSQTPFNMGKANIVLTGFMGSGKTTVGKQMAELLGYQFVDTDELIEARFGRSISEIFAELGESAFRQIERDIAQEISTQEKLVISTGGRLMLDPINVEALSRQGRVFCLVATPQEILTRVSNDTTHKRPLLAVPNPEERIVELLQERSDKYRRFPQVITDQIKPFDVAQNLIELINTDPKHFVIDQTLASTGFIVGAGLLPFFRQLANLEGPAVVITERQVRELYGPSFSSVDRIIELQGEGNDKSLASAEKVYEQLLEIGFDRTGTIISLGGSAVGDVAGFVAATYMRGVNLIHCPTSLIAMIDTSIGGKTGLDLPNGKNIIGVYKQPATVIADVTTLQTLPSRAFSSGMAEVIKHSLLAQSDLLEQVERGLWNSGGSSKHLSIAELQTLVAQAIQVKISIVQEDPFERGRRTILNLGHTFGYAIEQVSRNAFTHGECVGLGLVAAANLSTQLGYLKPGMQHRIQAALRQFNLPIRIPNTLSPEALLQAMFRDKKKQGNQLQFILLRGIGDAFVAHDVPHSAILETLEAMRE